MSLEQSDAEAAAVAVAPRVTLADIEAAIADEHSFIASDVTERRSVGRVLPLDVLTIHLIVLKNGFTFVGKSAPASLENFDKDLGRKFAREDAIRQIWPMMGFALRERLAAGAGA